MNLFNLKVPAETVSFEQAVKQGLGQQRGLFFPDSIPQFDDIDAVLDMPFVQRSAHVLSAFLGEELGNDVVSSLVENAFTFDAPLKKITDSIYSLELFHGPTLAFKDFGGRFMAQCLSHLSDGQPITILTATSGDTGAAVAHAFHGIENINVVIMFPKGKISSLQQKLFTTLGDNIHTIAVDGDFDQCQQLVKDCFDDPTVRQGIHLNSANSINISRLLAQVCYYFEAVAQLPKAQREQSVFSIPSGNFGNLTAAMIAKSMGLPIKRFIAATNLNDTVPRYLKTGEWQPKSTVATMSNAMDVSQPNNWPRIEALVEHGYLSGDVLTGDCVDEEYTQLGMKKLQQLGYVSEPHAAIGYKALLRELTDDEVGIFLGTAHPAKFRETVENILGQPISLPQVLADASSQPCLAIDMAGDYEVLKAHLLAKYS